MLLRVAPTPFLSARATLDIAALAPRGAPEQRLDGRLWLKARMKCGPLKVDGRQLTEAGP